MATIINSKRPFKDSPQKTHDIIDLTFDEPDNHRPRKRPRSSSHTPPISVRHALAGSKRAAVHGQKGPFVLARSPSPPVVDISQWTVHQIQPVELKTDSTAPSAKSTKPAEAISSGIRQLSIRPLSNSETNDQRTKRLNHRTEKPLVISLDTDSESEGKYVSRAPASRSTRTASPKAVQQRISSESTFFPPEITPIRFDPKNPSYPADRSKSAKQSQSRTYTATSSIRKPIVQIPGRPTAPPQQDVRPPKPPAVVVNLPPHPSQQESQRKDMIRQLQNGSNFMRGNPEEVSRVTGVANFVDTDFDEQCLKHASQKKHKQGVDRGKLALDFEKLSLVSKTTTTASGSLIHPRQQSRQLLNERFKTKQLVPLSFENQRNERRLHGKFQFVSTHILSKKARSQKQIPLQQRKVQRLGQCGAYCATFGNEKKLKLPDGTTQERSDGLEFLDEVLPYHCRPNGLTVLSEAFLQALKNRSDRIVIFECGEYCSSPRTCTERVVERGRTLPLQVFETKFCGFGVRTLHDIAKGQFIDVYLGEVLTNTELTRREAAAEEDAPAYVMSLDVFLDNEQSMFQVDGQIFGSVTRYVNHSCEPNCKTLPVMPANGTKHLYHVAFFAIKDIPAGSELTIDYDPTLAGLTFDEGTLDPSIVQCRCGSSRCRKQLWRPRAEHRGRKRLLPNKDDD